MPVLPVAHAWTVGVNPFQVWYDIFGIPYGDALLFAVICGVFIGAYAFALGIPLPTFAKKKKNPRDLQGLLNKD